MPCWSCRCATRTGWWWGNTEELMLRGYLPVGKDFPVLGHPQTREEYALARTEPKRRAALPRLCWCRPRRDAGTGTFRGATGDHQRHRQGRATGTDDRLDPAPRPRPAGQGAAHVGIPSGRPVRILRILLVCRACHFSVALKP